MRTPTMRHSKEQRDAWHKGKPKVDLSESRFGWFNRVIVKDRNYRGAYTPSNFGLNYAPLKNTH